MFYFYHKDCPGSSSLEGRLAVDGEMPGFLLFIDKGSCAASALGGEGCAGLTQQLGQEHVGEQNQHARAHHRVGGGLAHFHGAALYGIAEEGRHARDDVGEEETFDDAHPYEPLVESMLQAQRQVVGCNQVTDVGRPVGAHDAHGRREDDEERHDRDESQYFRQDKIAGRVDAHDVERVYLLRHAHGSQFRGDVRPHLSRQYQTHDGTGKLQQHHLSRGIAGHPAGHPGTLDVHFHLNADDGADEERDEQDDGNGVHTQLRHLHHIALPEHAHPLWHAERPSHQKKVATEGREISIQ
jgi:hypothetical protein